MHSKHFQLGNHSRVFYLIILMDIVVFACGSTATPEPTLDVGLIFTQAFETAKSDYSLKLTQTAFAQPTQTTTPTSTPTLLPTNTPVWEQVHDASCLSVSSVFETGKVVEVVDGDTIKVLIDEKVYSIRYIGIDAPETTGGFYSTEATQKNTELIYGKEVFLVRDISDTDRFGRLLRYVIVDNIFVNRELVSSGYARASSYPPDTACDQTIANAEQIAMTSKIGIWQSPTQPPTILNTPANNPSGNCHPSYPDVCIPPPPPDLDCKDVGFRRFKVLPPDPHRFDGDNDGIGCES